ncbi:MAG: 16S rRNA (guanine(527)-N(7))-methyltransferase RsmG [Deltaproteobacteria bacterium]|nr:16S rRNA (guanine(527)-N(7))-methyltransferase RsmG [Deltaproteobacteria bacterium]
MTSQPVDPLLIERVAARAGLALDVALVTALARFGDLFLLWNEKINLGGRIDATELVERHFLDSFVAAQFIAPHQSVIDVGSGGGLPAIPLALVRPLTRFELHEPVGKKVAFLRTAVRDLDLGARVKVLAERVEAPTSSSVPQHFDVAMSRATLSPGTWLTLGRLLVQPRGRVLVFATDEEADGCVGPTKVLGYGVNRRLLSFDR